MSRDRRDRPPLPSPIGLLVEPIYRVVVERRNRDFDAGKRVTRLPLPVISVGNLSVGGTGKTPTVMRLIEWLRDAGHRPAVAMRGYKARPGEHSDEQREYLDRFPDLTVIADPDRASAITSAMKSSPDSFDCVILDDGFQHRFVARDFNLVLIDATRDPFTDRCLPAGWLREPVSSLARADAVLLTHAESVAPDILASLRTKLLAVNPSLHIATSEHTWESLRTIDGEQPVSMLNGKRVVVVCGIGNPAPFISSVQRAGAMITQALVMPDHHRWAAVDRPLIVRASADAELIVTTAKDWTKLRTWLEPAPPAPIVIPRVAIAIREGAETLREMAIKAADAHPATL